MDLKEWKIKNSRARNYAHFDKKVCLNNVWSYISNPSKISSHSFYPFIHYKLQFNKFNKKSGMVPKEREICYSSHIDRYIFQYYSFKLNETYNERVRGDNIDNSVIAYRDNLGKSNIHFAMDAINFIRQINSAYIIVGDFTKFFDKLDHKYLKQRLCDLLNVKSLSDDYYAVFKNITKYSIWDMKILLKLNGLDDNKGGIKLLNDKDQVIPTELFKKLKKDYVKSNKECFGIPQGSAISAVLSNIYMLIFDKLVFDYVSNFNGLYMRYSDDFIIILPDNGENYFKEQLGYIKRQIGNVPNLILQPDKTQIYKYESGSILNCNKTFLDGIDNGKNNLSYLGFTFDGKVTTIRDKTISKYYYRMYRKLKTIVKNNGYTKEGKKINCKNLYLKYTQKGAHSKKGNFITYVLRAEKTFGKGEAINRSTKNHMKKIRKRLKQIT